MRLWLAVFGMLVVAACGGRIDVAGGPTRTPSGVAGASPCTLGTRPNAACAGTDWVSLSLKAPPEQTTLSSEGRLLIDKPADPSQPPRRTVVFLADFTKDAEAGDYVLAVKEDPHWTSTATGAPIPLHHPASGTPTSVESMTCVIQAESGQAPDATLHFTLSKGSSFVVDYDLPVGIGSRQP